MTTPPKLTREQYIAFLAGKPFEEITSSDGVRSSEKRPPRGKKRAREEDEGIKTQPTKGADGGLRRSARIAAQALKRQDGK